MKIKKVTVGNSIFSRDQSLADWPNPSVVLEAEIAEGEDFKEVLHSLRLDVEEALAKHCEIIAQNRAVNHKVAESLRQRQPYPGEVQQMSAMAQAKPQQILPRNILQGFDKAQESLPRQFDRDILEALSKRIP